MDPAPVEAFYGLLAIVAFAGVLGAVLLRIAALASQRADGWYRDVVDAIAPNALAIAGLVAVLATLGSLYFSEVAHFEACRLCWYQRIAMYPLVVILGIAAMRRDRNGAVYGLALAAIGAVISTYHVALEWIPALGSGTCDPDNPCSLIWFRAFGFISLPTMALAAFLLIATLLAMRLAAEDDMVDAPSDA